MVLTDDPIEFAGVIVGAITPRELTARKKQSRVDDVAVSGCDVVRVAAYTGHDLATDRRVERAEEEQFVF
ncbi:hypothetical protein D3C83_77370 [compost metagenome]